MGWVEVLQTEAAPSGLLRATVFAFILAVTVGVSFIWDRDDSLAKAFLERDGIIETAVGSLVAILFVLLSFRVEPTTDAVLTAARDIAVPITGALILAAILVENYRLSDRGLWPIQREEDAKWYIPKWAGTDGSGGKLIAVSAAVIVAFTILFEEVPITPLNAHLAGFPALGIAAVLAALVASIRLR